MLWTRLRGGQKVIYVMSIEKPADLHHIQRLAEEGSSIPVMDRTFPLEQIADAHRYTDSGQKAGSMIIVL